MILLTCKIAENIRLSTRKDANDSVESYYEYLNGINGNVVEARLMTYEEAVSLGCSDKSCSSAPAYLTYTSFWLGTSHASNSSVWGVFEDESFGADYNYDITYVLGVRPVIVVAD